MACATRTSAADGGSDWVVGAFVDGDSTNLKGRHTGGDVNIGLQQGTEKMRREWAAGGRVGWLARPQLLTFVSAGYTEASFIKTLRTGKKPEGEDLLRQSRRLLADADLLAERARALKGGQAGTLRVAAAPQHISSVLAPFLPILHEHRRRPGLVVGRVQ